MKALHKFPWHRLPHPWPHCSATKTKALNHLVSTLYRTGSAPLTHNSSQHKVPANAAGYSAKYQYQMSLNSKHVFTCILMPYANLPHLRSASFWYRPCQRNNQWQLYHHNSMPDIPSLFFFLFFYSNYNAIALPSILKVTMTLPSPCPASFRSCPCQRKQSMTY